MNSQAAFGDDLIYLLHSDLTSIVFLKSATSHKPAVINGEDYGIEQRLVCCVKRAVDEDIVIILLSLHP